MSLYDPKEGLNRGKDRYGSSLQNSKKFDESKITRDADGKFGSGGGKSNYSFKKESGEYSAPGVEAALIVTDKATTEKLLDAGLNKITGGKSLMIDVIEVQEDQQRSGKGSQALKDIEKIAKDLGQKYVTGVAQKGFFDRKDLPDLIKFYEKNGYTIYKKNQNDAIFYKKISD